MNNVKNLLYKTLILVSVFVNTNTGIFAQEQAAAKNEGLDGGSLDSQFNYVINKSNKYEDYQVVKKTWLLKIKSNSLDSIKALNSNIQSLETKKEEQQNEINNLKVTLKETNEKLDYATKEKDSFSFLGMLISKGSYNLLVWSLVFGLAIACGVIFFLFNRSNAITSKTKQALHDKQEEFDAHRKWALEREQTLARDLNKLKQKYKGLD